MIIVTILDVVVAGGSASGNGGTGAMLQFYNWQDARDFAKKASCQVGVPSDTILFPVLTVINTESDIKYRYYNDVEYQY